jgi:hypothetical protein
MRPSVRSALANTALVLASLAVTYLAASFVILRLLLPHLSLNLHPHFPDIAEVFAQTSKAGVAPHDYIALLGDSYAEGQGDGVFAADGDRAKFVHSAHVLHRLTGRDVISLGVGGAGSMQMMVRQPARILLGNCFLYPRLETPRQIFVYFYEGNDIDENGYIVNLARAQGALTRDAVARFVGDRYGKPPRLRCFTDLGETAFKMAHFALTNTQSFETLRKPSAHNEVMAGGAPHAAPALQKPPLDMEPSAVAASMMVFEVSLAWLRQTFPSAAITMVYLPSPAAIYRHAQPAVDSYVHWPLNDVQAIPADAIYATSQRTCEEIRKLTLAQSVRFIDMRPALRGAAEGGLIHGPRDWNHFNEAGYRVLGETLARTMDGKASTECRDWDAPR